MPLKLVVDAVEGRLAADWSSETAVQARLDAGLGECPVFGVNFEGDTPAEDGTFVQVSYPVANGEQLTIGAPGSNVYRETGTFQLDVMARRAGGVADGLTLADQLAALFRGKEFGGVQTFAPSSPAIDDRNDNGRYFILSVAVPYQADLFG
ncbi:hypothetical protein HCU64_06525 [Methylobacterium sp. C25]|uniref:phage tail terminator-like protein n=1 Tax=Methylobacterium sp. C25 TaxID=2721622 RepID=UPI001F28F4DD|nr:phage tail terminator-like protein [Methylobacterium sp. C25]MCE4223401.1 hypothetical protein [Methylobacterium sp. C25]